MPRPRSFGEANGSTKPADMPSNRSGRSELYHVSPDFRLRTIRHFPIRYPKKAVTIYASRFPTPCVLLGPVIVLSFCHSIHDLTANSSHSIHEDVHADSRDTTEPSSEAQIRIRQVLGSWNRAHKTGSSKKIVSNLKHYPIPTNKLVRSLVLPNGNY